MSRKISWANQFFECNPKTYIVQMIRKSMKLAHFIFLGLLLVGGGILLHILHILYESIWEIRSLLISPVPVSTFANPAILLGMLVLIFVVVGGGAFALIKTAMKTLKDTSNEIAVVLIVILFLILIDCLLHSIYFICVEGYHSYVSYRIAAALTESEEQLLPIRDIINEIQLRNYIVGAIFFLMTPFVWLAKNFLMKAINV
jgi:hypothetical protein